MGSHKFILAAFVVVLAVAATAFAQDDEVSLAEMLGASGMPSSDVKHTTIFPEYPTKGLPTNTLIDTYTSFSNNGQKVYNVTSLYGFINDAANPEIFVQNLTRLGYNYKVEPGEKVTFEFQFIADPAMESRDYILTIRADFHDVSNGMPYTATLVNSTVSFHEQAGSRDWTGTIVTVAIIGGSVAYVANKYLQKKAKKAAKSAKMSSQHDDLLAGTTLQGFAGPSSPKAATSPSAKSKK